ncbi:mannosyltransferase [Trypanosoma rangeli]|uniref:GPI mannosyltransferase 1 n=1 Tax=Trypanosoma rangeli TaxID=5698 RepID=A0A422P3K4_TRYRA|nr:mannosyltransferase [Trypanosoma rangeli]RNF12254.1 mannosyltransferase [Trypanosoma rangeli]|eukprot:RNF12254.1 mannosyltransferase [Trypanosoma rangeli]
MRRQSVRTWFDGITIGSLMWVGALVRLLLIVYAYFHDSWCRIKYTDIDYMIIVDGARDMWLGGSPFDRATFRYTPLLAVLMLPSVLVANPLGKLLFTLCDLGAAYYSYLVIVTFATERSAKWMVSFFILFNPIVLNVSTRGNSDMLVTFLSILVLAKFTQSKYFQAAAVLGFAIHFKLYPVIYVLPLTLSMLERAQADTISRKLKRVLPELTLCGLLVILFFAIPTMVCYQWFGQQYLDEAFMYHLRREDHRHNFSPYWLLMYLNMASRHLGVGTDYVPGLFAFLPQALVLLFVSYKLRRNVAHACCVQTMLFVAFNKVCTVQYFVWFLPFMAFLFSKPREGEGCEKLPGLFQTIAAVSSWGVMIPLWMLTAVQLEFQGRSDFGRLWVVSCVFFMAMVALSAWLTRIAYRIQEVAAQQKRGKKSTVKLA